MKTKVKAMTVFATATALAMAAPQQASAETLHSTKLAQWGDPLSVQTRTECIGYAIVDLLVGELKTCSEWKTETRHREVEVFLDIDGPADLAAEAKDAAVQCAVLAGIAAVGAGYASAGITAAAAAKAALVVCLTDKGYETAESFEIKISERIRDTDWG